jgi:hypothetical protein
VDDVGLDHHVLVNELGGVGVVGVYATDLGRGQNNLVWFLALHEFPHRGLIAGVEFVPLKTIQTPIYSKIANQPNNHSVNFDLNKLERTDKNRQFCIMSDCF